MAMHRRLTFAKGTMGRFIKKHGLTMTYLQVPAIMICKVDTHPGQKHFILTFRKPDGRLLKVPYSQGSAVKDYPEIVGVLDDLISDVQIYHEYQTPEAYCDAFEIPEDECEDDFELLKSIAEQVLAFLGAEAYTELLELQSEGGFEMEGDMGWQRSLTCGL